MILNSYAIFKFFSFYALVSSSILVILRGMAEKMRMEMRRMMSSRKDTTIFLSSQCLHLFSNFIKFIHNTIYRYTSILLSSHFKSNKVYPILVVISCIENNRSYSSEMFIKSKFEFWYGNIVISLSKYYHTCISMWCLWIIFKEKYFIR